MMLNAFGVTPRYTYLSEWSCCLTLDCMAANNIHIAKAQLGKHVRQHILEYQSASLGP